MSKSEFLSDEWFTAVAALMTEHGADAPSTTSMMLNMVITDTPWGEREMHMGAVEGQAKMGQGHSDGADVTMTTDYITAKEVFVSGNQQAGMQAFMAGRVKVQGDMTKLMMAQQGGGPGGNQALTDAIQEMTE
ncbi:MAG: SCP2 sterol-binding domain-containing protein [Acidimicrobiia bacterium]|nr:SCP2 sterol-binding domain-containing protein [Acidimicrobiia bacterium]